MEEEKNRTERKVRQHGGGRKGKHKKESWNKKKKKNGKECTVQQHRGSRNGKHKEGSAIPSAIRTWQYTIYQPLHRNSPSLPSG